MTKSNEPVPDLNDDAPVASKGSSDREPIEELAEEFAERHRRGERPTIGEYCERYPELATEIRDLFPAVITMERLNHRKRQTNGRKPGLALPIERLGDFRVVSEIARGGMGIVYEAEQVTLGRHVAVKVLPKHALRSDRDIQRFQREAQTAAKLHHTNIVPVFGVGQQDDTHYIVMQLIRGVGLDEILTQLRRIVFSLPNEIDALEDSARSSCVKRNANALLHEELRRDSTTSSTSIQEHVDTQRIVTEETQSTGNHRRFDTDAPTFHKRKSAGTAKLESFLGKKYCRNVALIGLQAASALSHAHQQDTLHRDVKPGNLLLDDEGVVWMADFGIAKALDHDNVTWTGDLVGTLCYMAPERFQGTTNAQCDIYSLGLTLFELLTLSRAFDGTDRVSVVHQVTNDEIPNPRKINSSIPLDLETIVLKAVARNPRDRYPTADHLASDLDAFLNDRPISARRMGYVEHFSRWCQRNRAVANLAAAVLILLIVVFAVTAVGYVREAEQRRRAESTSQLAVSALDEIYGQFAPRQLPALASNSDAPDDEGALLAGQGQLPLSKDVALLLENLLKFYDDLSQQSSHNASVVLKSIRANRRVGDIQHRLGELDKAQTAYERAIERIQKMTIAEGTNQELDLEFARTENGLGMVLEDKSMREKAADAHRKARDRLDETSSLATVKYELARTLYLLQLAERKPSWERRSRRKDKRTTAEHLTRAIAILVDLSEKHPTVSEYQFLLAKCYMATASPSHCEANKQDEYQTIAIDILEKLVRRSPKVADYQYELGDAYVGIVWRGRKRGEKTSPQILSVSEKRMERALEVTTDLDLNHPNIPEYLMLKSRMHHVLAKILKDLNRWEEAEHHYDKAIEKQQLVVRQARHPVCHEVWRMHIALHRVQLQRERENYGDAQANLQSMISTLKNLVQDPELQKHSHSRRKAADLLSKSYIALSDVFRKTGKLVEADQALRNAEQSR